MMDLYDEITKNDSIKFIDGQKLLENDDQGGISRYTHDPWKFHEIKEKHFKSSYKGPNHEFNKERKTIL